MLIVLVAAFLELLAQMATPKLIVFDFGLQGELLVWWKVEYAEWISFSIGFEDSKRRQLNERQRVVGKRWETFLPLVDGGDEKSQGERFESERIDNFYILVAIL